MNFTGHIADVNRAISLCVYSAELHFNTHNAPPDEVTIIVSDLGEMSAEGDVSVRASFYVGVAAVNDAPRVRVPGMVFRSSPITDPDRADEGEYELAYVKTMVVEEDVDLPVTGVTVVDVDAQGEEDGTLIALSVKALHGTVTLGADGHLPEGVYVLSGENGASAIRLRTTLDRANAALEYLVYRGLENWHGTDFLTILVDDLGSFGSGGSKTDLQTIPIKVTAVSDPPVWTVPEVPYAAGEDTPLLLQGVSVSDPDAFDPLENQDVRVRDPDHDLDFRACTDGAKV
jgi:hypothetical protein